MPPTTLQTEILDVIAAIPSEEHRRRALRGLAPLLDGEHMPRALTLAAALDDPFCRAQSLAALAARLPGDEQPAVLHAALDAIHRVQPIERRATVLAYLAALADDALGGEQAAAVALDAIESIRACPPDEAQAHLLASLPPFLDAAAAAGIAAIPAAWLRCLAWGELAAARPPDGAVDRRANPALQDLITAPDALLRAALDYQQITDLSERMLAAPGMFPLLPFDDRDDLLRELLEESAGRGAPPAQPGASKAGRNGGSPRPEPHPVNPDLVDSVAAFTLLDGALEYLPDDLLAHALALARCIQEPAHRMGIFARLAPRLSAAGRQSLADEGRAYLAALEDEFGLAAGLAALARFYPPERLEAELVPLAEGITDGWARADALSALGRALGPEAAPRRVALFEAALIAARSPESAWKRARALTIVAGRV